MSLLSKRREAAEQLLLRGVPQYLIPGAFPERGADYQDYRDDTTVMVGGDLNTNEEEPAQQTTTTTTTLEAVDAVVVDSPPPLVPAQVDKTCTIHDRRLQIAVLLLLLLVVGAVLGIVFGLPPDNNSESTTPSASPTTIAPTLTTLTWVQVGGLDGILDAASFSLSPDGTRVAVVDATNTVQVYQQNGTQLGDAIIDTPASSLSLSGEDHLAVGSTNNDTTTTGQALVFKLLSGVWTRIGSTISTQGWTVVLSKDATVLAVETADSVQVYHRVNDDGEWTPRGNSISTMFSRVDQGRAYSRLAMNHDGTVLIVDLSIYNYEDGQWTGGFQLPVESSPPNTPVSMSGDGRVVAIAQPQSTINGLNTGRVVVFQLDGTRWKQKGQSIVGDGQINGFWGFSHALSEDGSRIAIMNNPLDQKNLALVFRFEGFRWIRLVEDEVPQASSNGTIAISEDASRVAIGGQGIVRLYDIVSE